MSKLSRLILTTLCTAVLPFAAGAQDQAPPLAFEELPAEALLRVSQKGGGTTLLPDGGELRLSYDRRSLEIRRLSQVQRIALPQEANGIASHLQSVGIIQLWGAHDVQTQGYPVILVHLKTGKVHLKPTSDKAVVHTFGEGSIIVASRGSYEHLDTETGELKFLKVRKNPDSQGISYASSDTSLGQVIRLEEELFLRRTDGSWQKLEGLPASISYCDDRNIPGVLDCNGGNARALLFPEGRNFRRFDLSEKTLLALHRDRRELLWVKELTDLNLSPIQTLNLTEFATGQTRQIQARDLDPNSQLDIFTPFMNNYLLWFKNKELEVVTQDQFWAAFDAKKLGSLRGQGRRLGRAQSVADLLPLLQNEYAAADSDRSKGEWQIGIRDGVLSYAPKGASASQRFFLGSDPQVQLIPRTSLAHLTFRVGSNSFNVLLDLRSHRAFELGSGYMRIDSSERGDRILISRGSEEWLVLVSSLNTTPNWRGEGLTSGPTRPELGEDILGSCTTPELGRNQGLASELLRLRQTTDARQEELGLKTILAYQLNQGELRMVAQVIQKWMANAPEQARLSFRRLKLAERLQALKPGFPASPCLSQTERDIILRTQLKDLFAEATNQNIVGLDIYGIQHLVALQPLVREFGYANDAAEDILATKLGKASELHPQLQGVFPSKLYYFAKAVMNPIFGRAMKFKTDVTVNQDKKISHITLMSTLPTYGQRARRNSFGFYHGVVASMEVQGQVGSQMRKRLEWRSGGRPFAADLTLTKSGDLSHLVPPAPSLDYAALNRDRKLVGLMVVGTNIGHAYTIMTMGQYASFYRRKGYEFDENRQVPNSLEFMRGLIQSGELDYLVKEAHSDGDEKNLFRAARVGELRTGRRVNPETGRTEIIHLLAPQYGTGGSMAAGDDGRSDDLIPNQLFGEWIREREKAGQGPLVYLNTSCSSATKVINEITATRSKLLVAIPSVTSVSLFTNSSTNSTAVFLEGLHEGLDWATIRERMRLSPEVKEERNNLFALPNEERFNSSVRQALGFSVDTDVKLTDLQSGRVFSVDEFNRDH